MTLRSRYANAFVQGNSNRKALFLRNECVSPILNRETVQKSPSVSFFRQGGLKSPVLMPPPATLTSASERGLRLYGVYRLVGV